ncbi:unnamed protein product [Polarella glacialis]|uniref:EH domain-containing protein n=1 Tax=Polarella glacialis TaxID=89957 RepID=A0A813IFC4_POLGL|nr:unnamed protein product [Polarella glacialis]
MSGYPQVPGLGGQPQPGAVNPNQAVPWGGAAQGFSSAMNPQMFPGMTMPGQMQMPGMGMTPEQQVMQQQMMFMMLQQQQQQQQPQQPQQPQQQQQQQQPQSDGSWGGSKDFSQAFAGVAESLSAVEQEYYARLWITAGCLDGKTLGGKAAFDFLSKSQVSRETLKRIWNLADWSKKHSLGWAEFVVTLKLISAAQKKQLVSLDRVLENCSPTSADCPVFTDIEGPPSVSAGAVPQTAMAIADAFLEFAPPTSAVAPSTVDAPLSPPLLVALPMSAPTAVEAQMSMPQFSLEPASASAEPSSTPDVQQKTGEWNAFSRETAASSPDTQQPEVWGAFGSQEIEAPKAQGVNGLRSKESETETEWGAFGSDEPAAKPKSEQEPEEEWAAFSTGLQPPLKADAGGTEGGTSTTSWADFPGDSGGGGGGAAKSPPAPASGGGGRDLWSKMSAFDDLLKDDDTPAPASAAAGAFEEAPAADVQPSAAGLTDRLGGICSTADQDFGEDDDDFGDFSGGAVADKSSLAKDGVAVGGTEAEGFSDFCASADPQIGSSSSFEADFGDFGGSSTTDDKAANKKPSEDLFAVDFPDVSKSKAESVSPAFDADFGDFGSTPAPADSAQNPAKTDFDADFGDADKSVLSPAGTVDYAKPASAADFGESGGSASKTEVAKDSKTDEFDADFGDFGGSASKTEVAKASRQNGFDADFGDVGGSISKSEVAKDSEMDAFDADFGEFGGSVCKTDVNRVSRMNAFDADGGDVAGSTSNTEVGKDSGMSAYEADFGDFGGSASKPDVAKASRVNAFDADFGDFGGSASKTEVAKDSGMNAFDANFGDFGSSSPSRAAASKSEVVAGAGDNEFGSFGGSTGSDATGKAAADDSSWSEFPSASSLQGAQVFASPDPGTGSGGSWASFDGPGKGNAAGKDFADLAGGGSSKSSSVPAPVRGHPPEADAEEDDADGAAGQARRLARSLASLRRFEEALLCHSQPEALRSLDAAEVRKKAAVANDDFEGAIKIRTEIKALTAKLVPEDVQEAWQRLVAAGEADTGLEVAAERLQTRCQWMDDALSSCALAAAISNFRRTCPARGQSTSLAALPGLVRRQRRARQMSRAIDAVSSNNMLHFLQVILACIGAMCELLGQCAEQVSVLVEPDWSEEERQMAVEAEEFQAHLKGVGGLRRLLWRLTLLAELFLFPDLGPGSPDGASPSAEETEPQTTPELEELRASAGMRLAEAKATWAKLESEVGGLRLHLEPWQEDACFEAGGCQAACPGTSEQFRVAPLCRLCLLPAVPLGLEAEIGAADPGAVSAPWRGGFWHVQCANFWLKHASTSAFFLHLGMEDPFSGPSLS